MGPPPGNSDDLGWFSSPGVIVSGDTWMYPIGAAFSAVGLIRLAPTRGSLERDQEALNLAGCRLSLTYLLVTSVDAHDS